MKKIWSDILIWTHNLKAYTLVHELRLNCLYTNCVSNRAVIKVQNYFIRFLASTTSENRKFLKHWQMNDRDRYQACKLQESSLILKRFKDFPPICKEESMCLWEMGEKAQEENFFLLSLQYIPVHWNLGEYWNSH